MDGVIFVVGVETKPVFSDSSGRRAVRVQRAGRAACVLIAALTAALALTLTTHVSLPGLDHPLTSLRDLTRHQSAPREPTPPEPSSPLLQRQLAVAETPSRPEPAADLDRSAAASARADSARQPALRQSRPTKIAVQPAGAIGTNSTSNPGARPSATTSRGKTSRPSAKASPVAVAAVARARTRAAAAQSQAPSGRAAAAQRKSAKPPAAAPHKPAKPPAAQQHTSSR